MVFVDPCRPRLRSMNRNAMIPSMGKTALCLNIAQQVALHKNLPVGMFSLEMSKEQLLMRMLCAEARVDAHKVHMRIAGQREVMQVALAGHAGNARVARRIVVALEEQAMAIQVGKPVVHLEPAQSPLEFPHVQPSAQQLIAKRFDSNRV